MIKTRLAPTPSGYLHLGNLYNFILVYNYAKSHNGRLQLRIDDADATRSRPEYITDIFESLKWMGFSWDDGPISPDDFIKNYSQTAKTEIYREWLKHFPGYACDCSRQSIQKRTSAHYDGCCRDKQLPLIKNVTQWRVKADDPKDDIVLWRKEDLPAYHLVSLYEDITYGSNVIIRGEDLKESTEAQKRLAVYLGWEGAAFLNTTFVHHPLLLDKEGNKLSKSAGATSLKFLRESGYSQSDICGQLSLLTDDSSLLSFFNEPR